MRPAARFVQKGPWLVGVGAGIYTAIFSYFSWQKFVSFSYRDWDLAIYANFLHNAASGNFFSPLLGIPYFGNHLNLLLLLLVPVYALFPSPYTLLFLQSCALGLAAFPVYLIFRARGGEWFGVLCAFIFLVHPAIHLVNLNEFHPESFFPLLFFTAFLFLKTGRTGWFLAAAFACLALKENFSLAVFTLGVYAMSASRTRKAGAWLAGISLAYGAAAFLFVIPGLNQGRVGYYNIYPQFGSAPGEILAGIAGHPLQALRACLAPVKLKYLFELFAPVGFLSVVSPATLLLGAPLFGQHLLSSRPTEFDLTFYYSSELLPFIFLSAFYGMARVREWIPEKRRVAAGVLAAVMVIGTGFFIGKGHFRPASSDSAGIPPVLAQEMLARIPKNAGTIATFGFLPGLANRASLYSFHYVYTGTHILTDKKFVLPGDIAYAMIDMNDPSLFGQFYQPQRYSGLQGFFIGQGWRVEGYVNSLLLLKKDAQADFDLTRRIDALPGVGSAQHAGRISTDEGVALAAFEFTPDFEKGYVDAVFYWEALAKPKKDIQFFLDLEDTRGTLLARVKHPVCWRIFPTQSWEQGELYRDTCRFYFPQITRPGEYRLWLGMYEHGAGTSLPMSSLQGRGYKAQLLDLRKGGQ